MPSAGTVNLPVILINFADTSTSYTVTNFENLLFGDNPTIATGPGSMKDYYEEASYGQLTLSSGTEGVTGWFTADYGHDPYGDPDEWGALLVYEAVQKADDAGFDFSDYDNDDDGYVDGVIVIHQGNGEDSSGVASDIWSHRWNLYSAGYYGYGPGMYQTNDGVIVNDYSIQPETTDENLFSQDPMTTMGVVAHETGHLFGLPDLYDTDYSSEGIGDWGMMAGGSWNGVSRSGDSPAHFSAWSKWVLGWVNPEKVSPTSQGSLPPATSNSKVYQFLSNPNGPGDWGGGSGEYFLSMYRKKTGFDAGLPGEGLLVWHVDEAQSDNDNESHKLVDLEAADGNGDMDSGTNQGDAGDPFPGPTLNRRFSDTTNPNAKLYDGSNSGIDLNEIWISLGKVWFNTPPDLTPQPTTYSSGQSWVRDGQGVTVNVSSTDNQSGVASVTVDASSISTSGTVSLTKSGGYWTASVTPDKGVTGIFSLPVTSTDNYGFLNDTESVTVKVDNTPPSINSLGADYPSGQSRVKAGDILEIEGNFSDLHSGFSNATVNATPINSSLGDVPFSPSPTWFAPIFYVGDVPSGTYGLNVTAYDNASNTDTSTVQVQVDNGEPVAKLSSPIEGEAIIGTVEIRGEANDSTSFDTWELDYWDGNSWNKIDNGTSPKKGNLTSQDTSSFPDGHLELRLTVRDRAGHVNTSYVNVTVDNEAPGLIFNEIFDIAKSGVYWTQPTQERNASQVFTNVSAGKTGSINGSQWSVISEMENVSWSFSPDGVISRGNLTYLARTESVSHVYVGFGNYDKVEIFGEPYVAVDNDTETLVEPLPGSNQSVKLEVNETLELEGGVYSIQLLQLDVNGDKALINITRYGTVEKTVIVDLGSGHSASDENVTYDVDIGTYSDVPVMKAHVSNISGFGYTGNITIDGYFQLESSHSTPSDFEKGIWDDAYGGADQPITMESERGLDLNPNTSARLYEDKYLKTEGQQDPVQREYYFFRAEDDLDFYGFDQDQTGVANVYLNTSPVSTAGLLNLTSSAEPSEFQDSFPVDKKVSDGVYALNVTSVDVSGRENNTQVVLGVDETPPSGVNVSAEDKYNDESGSYVVSWSNSSDDTSGLLGFHVYSSNQSFVDIDNATHITSVNNSTSSIEVNGTIGEETWVAVVPFDNANNINETFTPVNVTPRDDLAPRLDNESPSPGSRTTDHTPTISADFVDASGANNSSTKVWFNGANVTSSVQKEGTGFTYGPGQLSDGTYTVTVYLNDSRGYAANRSWSFEVYTKSDGGGGGGSGSSGGGGGGGGSPAEDPDNIGSRFIDYIWNLPKSEAVEFSFETEGEETLPVVSKVRFVYDDVVSSEVKVDLQELVGPTTLRDKQPPGEVYRHFNLYVNLPLKTPLQGPELELRVESNWLEENGLTVNQLRLARWNYDDETWNLVELEKAGESNGYVILETVDLPGFSQYAVTAVEKEESRPKETTAETSTPTETPVPTETPAATAKSPEENVPGFTWFPTALAMIAVLFLTRWQR